MIVPDAQIERQPVDRPLILDEGADIPQADLVEEWRCELPDDKRGPVPERIVHAIRQRVAGTVEDALKRLNTRLEQVRSGDVGHRRALGVVVVDLLGGVVGAARNGARKGAPHVTGRLFGNGDVGRTGLPVIREADVLDQELSGRLEEESIGRRMSPRRLRKPHRPVPELVLRFGRRPGAGADVQPAAARTLRLECRADLMLLGGLQGEPAAGSDLIEIRVRRPVQVGLVPVEHRRLVEVVVRPVVLAAPVPRRPEEPQPVPHDWSANAQAVVPDLLD